MSGELTERIKRCEAEAERCHLLSTDESLTPMDRVHATQGYLDWMTAKAIYEDDLRDWYKYT